MKRTLWLCLLALLLVVAQPCVSSDGFAGTTIQISGSVRDEFGPLVMPVTISATDGAASATTAANGTYSLQLPSGWSGTLVPSSGIFTFSPASRSYTDVTEDQRGQDYVLLSLFQDSGILLPEGNACAAAWGDYDADGDPDLALAVYTGTGNVLCIYRNEDGVFSEIGVAQPGFRIGSLNWVDYDNDGDIDLICSGARCRVYRNDNGSFTMIDVGLAPVYKTLYGGFDWGDYDNDGDLDALPLSQQGIRYGIFRNDGGTFVEADTGLPKMTGIHKYARFADYDLDGDLDVAFSANVAVDTWIIRLYRNDGGRFVDTGWGGTGIVSVSWGDFDNDGDPDLFLHGNSPFVINGATYTGLCLFRNDSGTLAPISIPLYGYPGGNWMCLADCDGDGDLDVVLDTSTASKVRMYLNDDGLVSPGAIGIGYGLVGDWADYDGDGDLDLITCPATYTAASPSIRRNDMPSKNTRPTPPAGLNATSQGDDVIFTWEAGSDAETPPAGLSYALRVGTTPGGSEVVSSLADPVTGTRLVLTDGPVRGGRSWTLSNAPRVPLYWSVQSIDTGWFGSAWASPMVVATPASAGMVRAGAIVQVSAVVTAVFDDCVYIEDESRVAGIRVEGNVGEAAVDDRVRVTGAMGVTDDLELRISASSTVVIGTGHIAPLHVNAGNLGGDGIAPATDRQPVKAWRWVKTEDGEPATRELASIAGMSNLSLLVRCTGKVVWAGPGRFYLDDGSARDDFEHPDPVQDRPQGLRVLLPEGVDVPETECQVAVTGISSCHKNGDNLFRVLRVWRAEDIAPVPAD